MADFETRHEDLNDGLSVNIRSYQSESSLLNQAHDVVFHRIESNQNLIVFNADSWKGGIDSHSSALVKGIAVEKLLLRWASERR